MNINCFKDLEDSNIPNSITYVRRTSVKNRKIGIGNYQNVVVDPEDPTAKDTYTVSKETDIVEEPRNYKDVDLNYPDVLVNKVEDSIDVRKGIEKEGIV